MKRDHLHDDFKVICNRNNLDFESISEMRIRERNWKYRDFIYPKMTSELNFKRLSVSRSITKLVLKISTTSHIEETKICNVYKSMEDFISLRELSGTIDWIQQRRTRHRFNMGESENYKGKIGSFWNECKMWSCRKRVWLYECVVWNVFITSTDTSKLIFTIRVKRRSTEVNKLLDTIRSKMTREEVIFVQSSTTRYIQSFPIDLQANYSVRQMGSTSCSLKGWMARKIQFRTIPGGGILIRFQRWDEWISFFLNASDDNIEKE